MDRTSTPPPAPMPDCPPCSCKGRSTSSTIHPAPLHHDSGLRPRRASRHRASHEGDDLVTLSTPFPSHGVKHQVYAEIAPGGAGARSLLRGRPGDPLGDGSTHRCRTFPALRLRAHPASSILTRHIQRQFSEMGRTDRHEPSTSSLAACGAGEAYRLAALAEIERGVPAEGGDPDHGKATVIPATTRASKARCGPQRPRWRTRNASCGTGSWQCPRRGEPRE